MDNFKEQIRDDFSRVLLDTSIFGRTCSWNGAPLDIAEDARIESQGYKAEGINANKKIIYCRDIDLEPIPTVTEEIDLDGEIWTVDDVKRPFGHLIITLVRTAE